MRKDDVTKDDINENIDSEEIDYSELPEEIRDDLKESNGTLKKGEMYCTQEEFNKLIVDNMNFPYSIVNKEFGTYPIGIKDELNSAAMEGMVYAATKYNPKRANECKFISYAVHWIRYYINEEIRKLYPVRFNQNFISKRKKVMTCISKYEEEHNGEKPTPEYISKQVGMTQKVVKNILKINGGKNFTFISFNMPIESDDAGGNSEALNSDRLVKQYLEADGGFVNPTLKIEVQDLLNQLKSKVSVMDYQIFYDYYMNGENFSDLAKKYKLKFPSSAAYLIKKCEKKCKDILSEVD